MRLAKLATIVAVAVLPAFSSAMAATPLSLARIERWGNVYAKNVCTQAATTAQARCFAKVVTDSQGVIRPGKTQAQLLLPRAVPQGFGPADLRSAYKVTGTGSSSYTIAIVDAYGYANAEKDLATYRAQYGLPACTTANGCFKKVTQTGATTGYPRAAPGWAQEQALDLDMASAMCPN